MGDHFSPDETVFVDWGFVKLNATIFYTWIVMAVLVIGSWLITRKLSSGKEMSRWQGLLEVVVGFLRREIRALSNLDPDSYLPFVGTLFVFIATSSVLELVPGFTAPTGSISTTFALAACVFVAVPVFGILHQGVGGYLKNYVQPSPFMLPFNLIGEASRTLALAVRLFGNVMSGTKVVGILLSIIPFVIPAVMSSFGLLLGMIQAYIFAVLTMVYISSGMRGHEAQVKKAEEKVKATGKRGDEPARPGESEEDAEKTEKGHAVGGEPPEERTENPDGKGLSDE